jgi:energy-coupling factor transporter ATP-binding protein EcfA2
MSTTVPAPGTVITRITEVSLQNFCGFKGKEPFHLNTNADLVLLTGPNGCGKTSFMEALLLLLTGWYGDRDPVQHLLSRHTMQAGDTEAQPYEHCELAARAMSGDTEITLSLKWNRDQQRPLPMPTGLPPSQLADDPQDPNQRELDARLCGFFQDRVTYLFDEAAKGHTLRDVFEPLPLGLKKVQEDLPKIDGDLQMRTVELEKLWQGESPEVLNAALNQAFQEFLPHYFELAKRAEGWPTAMETLPVIVDDAALDDFAWQVLQAAGFLHPESYAGLRDAFEDALTQQMRRQIKMAQSKALRQTPETEDLEQQIEDLQRKIQEIKQCYPTLEEDVQVFAADDATLPDAVSVFRALAANAQRWSQVQIPTSQSQETQHFKRALEELAAIQEQEAGKCANALDAWLRPRRNAYAELQRLEQDYRRLQERREKSFISEEVSSLKELQIALRRKLSSLLKVWQEKHSYTYWKVNEANRRLAREYLASARRAVDWCNCATGSITRPSAILLEALRERAQTVLRRFSLLDGFLPLRLEAENLRRTDSEQDRRVYRIKTADGRELQHFSAGQCAQVAVSLLTSQNLAIPHMLSHRVILLDGVTTAYDLSNLTQEAIFWRQLAYGGEHEQERRQLFISSHYEDMTNHLLDLLVPPQGKEMRLIRFTDWSPETGPKFKELRVIPTETATYEVRAELTKDLNRF